MIAKNWRRLSWKLAGHSVLLLAGFSYGALASQNRWFPYRPLSAAYRGIGSVWQTLFDSEESNKPPGDWSFARTDRSGLRENQRAAIEQLRTLGYASGSELPGEATGVTNYDPARAYDGLNLWTDGSGPHAVLMDMEGTVLHSWRFLYEHAFPEKTTGPDTGQGDKNLWRRVRLLEHGDLLAIYEGRGLIKIDSDSKLLWAYPGQAHHDLDVTDEGRIYVLTREAEILPRMDPDRPILHDFVTVLTPGGVEVSRISILEAIERSEYSDLLQRMSRHGDAMHTNTLEILDGRLSDRLPAFRAGNILLSIREINTVAVLDPMEERIVWALSGPWIKQHEPTVLENGRLLVFDNLGAGGQSRVLEFDPLTQQIEWTYDGREHDLLSGTIGSSQRLPNGNTLITESNAGRALEVARDGTIVWEFHTPNRAGEDDRYIATLWELIRLDATSSAPSEWW